MEFHYNLSDLVFISSSKYSTSFDLHFKRLWENASTLCRYQLTQLENRILNGKYRFVAQVNPPRTKRRPNFVKEINPVFDASGFNFNQVPSDEILFKLKFDGGSHSHHLVINVNPLEYGSSLLVPSVKQCLPQRVTREGLQQLIHIMLLSNDRNFRSGFSSPGGFASVNHQHYHVYYLQERLYIEDAEVEPVCGPCYTLKDYPAKGFVFELVDNDVNLLISNVYKLLTYLQSEGIAHNMFLTRGKSFKDSNNNLETLRVFVWGREPSFVLKDNFFFKPALCELAGHLLLKECDNMDLITEDNAVAILESLTWPYFRRICSHIHALYAN